MRRLRLFAIVGVATVCSAGVALATHVPQVDPATVPEGFLAAHNEVEGIRMSSIERAVEDGKADVFIQHARLDPNAATPWHTHPALYFSRLHLPCSAGRGLLRSRGWPRPPRRRWSSRGTLLPGLRAAARFRDPRSPAEAPEECTPGGGSDNPSDKSDDHDNHHHDHHDDDDAKRR